MTKVYETNWGRYEVVGAVVTDYGDPENDIPPTLDNRCHVNAQGDVPSEWGTPVTPEVPMRKFATGETLYYRFDTLEAFRAVEPELDESPLP